MREYTDRHFRRLARLLSRRATLYSEMHKPAAIVAAQEAGRERQLLARGSTHGSEVLQLGGNVPGALAAAAARAVAYGYGGVDLNAGCPSVVAGGGDFGASLMRDASRTAACLEAMMEAVEKAARESGLEAAPVVSLKCRVAVAETENEALEQRERGEVALEEGLREYLGNSVMRVGVRNVTVHARQAVMRGLSPSANREVPPLMHGVVARTAAWAAASGVRVTPNGGVDSEERAREVLQGGSGDLAGVMAGRWVLLRPLDLARVDSVFYGDERHADGGLAFARGALEAYGEHIELELAAAGGASPAELALPLALVAAQLEDDEDCEWAEGGETLLECIEAVAQPLLAERRRGGLGKALAAVGGKKVGAKHRRSRAEAARMSRAARAPTVTVGAPLRASEAATSGAGNTHALPNGGGRRWQTLELEL